MKLLFFFHTRTYIHLDSAMRSLNTNKDSNEVLLRRNGSGITSQNGVILYYLTGYGGLTHFN